MADENNVNGAGALMAFEEFAKVYRATFAKMMTYSSKQVGSAIYVEKLAELSDAYPEWAEIAENSQEVV
jgi:hypothetical protein